MFYKIKAADSNVKGFIQRKNCDSHTKWTRVKDFIQLNERTKMLTSLKENSRKGVTVSQSMECWNQLPSRFKIG